MSKEAMKLALEALEKCDFALAEELAAWDIDPPLHHVLEASNACGPAITAIREALAEQPAQQEPVAWMYDQAKYRENDLRGRQWAFNCFSQNKPWVDDMVRNLTPLYTSPPAQRKPLTDEEIMKVWQPVAKRMYGIVAEGHSMDVLGIRNESMVLSLSRAIEAAHGIKENA